MGYCVSLCMCVWGGGGVSACVSVCVCGFVKKGISKRVSECGRESVRVY